MTTKLTFWQNSMSIHQAPLIRELASMPDVDVRVVVENGVSSERVRLGWTEPDYGAAEIHVAPDERLLLKIVQSAQDDSAHIFSGVGVYPMVETARIALLGSAPGKMIASTESIDTRGVLRKLRLWMRTRTLSARVSEYDSVLASGAMAVAQWRKIGGSGSRIREFGYFVDGTPLRSMPERTLVDPFRIVFVGSLEVRKDPDTLLRALALLPTSGWQATFVGDGALLVHLRGRAKKLGIADHVHFCGTLPNDDGRRVIVESTVLVLPSRHDGWGAVVNEALMDGVPSVVSRNVGASTLIRTPLQGATFRAGDEHQLAQALRKLIMEGRTSVQQRHLSAWSESSISPKAAADYLLEIVHAGNATPITPPWK